MNEIKTELKLNFHTKQITILQNISIEDLLDLIAFLKKQDVIDEGWTLCQHYTSGIINSPTYTPNYIPIPNYTPIDYKWDITCTCDTGTGACVCKKPDICTSEN